MECILLGFDLCDVDLLGKYNDDSYQLSSFSSSLIRSVLSLEHYLLATHVSSTPAW